MSCIDQVGIVVFAAGVALVVFSMYRLMAEALSSTEKDKEPFGIEWF